MASLFENAKKLLNWSESAGFRSVDLTRNYTWSDGVALAPILPPSVPFAGVTTSDALACPPVARGVGLYTSALLRHEWEAPEATLAWLNRPSILNGVHVPAKLRDVRTLVDLLLHNRSLWIVSRDESGAIHDAAHLPVDGWGINDQGQLLVGDQPVTDLTAVIYFQGAMLQPFLEAAKDTLGHYKDITNTVKSRGRNPMALVELKLLEDYDGAVPGDPDYDAEFDEALNAQKAWGTARRAEDGAVAITPRGIDVKVHQPNDDGQMLLDARNAVRLDVGNHMNLNAELLDGDNGTSDTYSNTLQNKGDFYELSLPLFFEPIALRLSGEDASPGGPVRLVPRQEETLAPVVGTPQAGGQLAPAENA